MIKHLIICVLPCTPTTEIALRFSPLLFASTCIASFRLKGISAPTQWVNTTTGTTNWLGGATDFVIKFKALAANTANAPPTYRAASALAMGVALEDALKLSTVTGTEGDLNAADVRTQFESLNVQSFYGKLAFASEFESGHVVSKMRNLHQKPMWN